MNNAAQLTNNDIQHPIHLNEGDIINERYLIIEMLSFSSGYSKNYIAEDFISNQSVVIKQMKNANNTQFINEVQVHNLINNNNGIYHMVDYFSIDGADYIVTTYCSDGDLYEALFSNNIFINLDDQRNSLISKMAREVKKMHQENIIHGDVKFENFLITQTTQNDIDIAICDFGCSKICDDDIQYFYDRCGTLEYCSPEKRIGTGYSFPTDIYSLGCCFDLIEYNHQPQFLNTLIENMTKTDPNERLTIEEVEDIINSNI